MHEELTTPLEGWRNPSFVDLQPKNKIISIQNVEKKNVHQI